MTLSWRPRWRSSLISPARDARAAGGRAAARGRRGGLGRGPLHARARPAQPRTQDALGVDEVGEHAARALDGDCKGGRRAACESARREMARTRETGHETEGARESRSEKRARSSPRRASKRPRARGLTARARQRVVGAGHQPVRAAANRLEVLQQTQDRGGGRGGEEFEASIMADIHARVFPIFHRAGILPAGGETRGSGAARAARAPPPAAPQPRSRAYRVPRVDDELALAEHDRHVAPRRQLRRRRQASGGGQRRRGGRSRGARAAADKRSAKPTAAG